MAFDANYYLQKNPDVAAAVARGETTPEQHYQQFGIKESRSPEKAAEYLNPSTYYSAVAPGVPQFTPAQLGTNSPNVEQNQQAYSYLLSNPDVAEAVKAGKTTALEHYNQFGKTEGRSWDTNNLPVWSDTEQKLVMRSQGEGTKSPTGTGNVTTKDGTFGSMLSGVYNNLPSLKPATGYVSPESLVSNQLTSLLQKNNPLFRLAENRSNEKANQMGLLSSNMAVGAGQKAIYDVAVPIATTDSSRYAAADLSQQNAYQNERLTGLQGNISSALQSQQDTAAMQRLNAQTTADLFKQQVIDNNLAKRLGIELDARLTESGMERTTQILTDLNNKYAEIDSIPDSQLDTAAKAKIKENYRLGTVSNIKAVSDISNVQVTWNSEPTSLLNTKVSVPETKPNITTGNTPITVEGVTYVPYLGPDVMYDQTLGKIVDGKKYYPANAIQE